MGVALQTAIGTTWAILWRTTLVLALVGGALVWWMNRDTGWNAAEGYVAAGSVREQRVGLVILAIAQPGRFDKAYWERVTGKILDKVVPWPINRIAVGDRGVVLVDPERPFAPVAFTPRRLADIDGHEADRDGTPWITRYRRGELEFVEPNSSMANDTGYFLYSGRRQGMTSAAAKIAAKARYLYYGQLRDGYLPHGGQTRAFARDAITLLRQRHPQIVAAEFVETFDAAGKRAAVRRILDTGVDVLVLGSGQAVHSDFEELRSGFSAIHAIVQEWRREHENRPVRIAVAPWMATEPGFDALWLDHFAASIPSATAPRQAAIGIVALHGLPPSMVGTDSWSQRWPATAARLKPRMAAILRSKGYSTVRVEAASEAFADAVEDPENKIISVNELYRAASARGDALAVALPIEFLAENTDTLFAHQAAFFAGIGGHRPYTPPPADIDWRKAYVRTLKDGNTTMIYAGAPGGAVQPRASIVLADAIGRVFPAPAQ